jgi:hypothetical protein
MLAEQHFCSRRIIYDGSSLGSGRQGKGREDGRE